MHQNFREYALSHACIRNVEMNDADVNGICKRFNSSHYRRTKLVHNNLLAECIHKQNN